MIDVGKLPRPATPGPWIVVHERDAVRIRPLYDGTKLVVVDVGAPGLVELDQDAEAIAALPSWIAACDERDAEIARLRDALADLHAWTARWLDDAKQPWDGT